MPRGKPVTKRKPAPDAVYQDARVTKFINYVMLAGKKDTARRIVYDALKKAAEQLKEDSSVVLEKALLNVRPELEVRARRVGGANYQIPLPVPRPRGDFLAMKWIIGASRSRKGKDMAEKLAEELVNAYNETGEAVKKKENTHKMAEANRAFAHFRW